ncbi:VWA domain-containing protein [Photobacterium lutimaris]|uniref:VWFA domain-containing protein n=1 Tax=Photobacterium lutimaris TaxID=388278 RepID=A0A2T3ITW1_9GAMM|nr:VWA domain-containing protein [Photobacterium lutimaris]PSU31782.1 hypothetical protein C9I99_21600 [Photobacterium lutimaris]TDR72565.1 von Willebrand factor type A domain-containing protein [Photobacterium lutimaris]
MLNIARNIMHDVPVLAGIYAGQYDCEIKIGGGKAFATKKMINIPFPKEETLDLTWCFVVHEAAHIRYSDFDHLEKWLDSKPKVDRNFYKKLLNIVEDTYIEKYILTEFPGSYEYLEAGGKFLAGKLESKEVTAENALSRFIFLYVRGHLTGYRALQALYKTIRKQCILHFGLPLIRELSKILERTLSSTCTQDNCVIVDEFVGFLENPQIEEEDTPSDNRPQNNNQDPNQPDDSDSNDDGDQPDSSQPQSDDGDDSTSSSEQVDDATDGDENDPSSNSTDDLDDDDSTEQSGDASAQPDNGGDDDDQANGSSNQPDDSTNDAGTGQPDDSSEAGATSSNLNSDDVTSSNMDDDGDISPNSTNDSGNPQEGGKADGKPQWSDDEIQAAIKAAMDRLADMETDTGDIIKEVIEDDENIDWDAAAQLGDNFSTAVSHVHQQPLNRHNTLSKDTSQATAALKQKLAALVAHKTRTKKTVEKRGRRFARGKVHRLAVGNPAVFSRKTRDEKKPNSSIVILVDDSGSIGNHLPDMQKATLALIDSLDSQKGVKVAAIAFGSEFGGSGELTRLKRFNERGDIVINRIASLTANGHTPLLNGLKAAKQDLHGVKNRKLVIVLTDGQPNDLRGCIDYIKQMQISNIDLVGVGIGKGVDVAGMQAQYGHNNYTMVPQFEQLPQAVMELSRHIVLD